MKEDKNNKMLKTENKQTEDEITNSSSDSILNNEENIENSETYIDFKIDDKIEKNEENLKILEEPKLSEDEEKKLQQTNDAVANQKSKKKKIKSLVGMLINIGIVVAILLVQIFGSEESVMPLSELFNSGINWWCLVLCFVLFFLVNGTNAWKMQMIIKYTIKKNRPALAYKVTAIGRYYDSITPLGTGGQPFQVYYLNKRGVDGSSALSIPLGNYVVYTSVFVVVSLVVMISSIATVSINSTQTAVVSTASWIGVSLNALLIFIIVFLSVSRKLGTKLITGIFKFLQKIKIIKNYEKQYNKVIKFVDDYQSAMRKYMKSKWTFFGMIVLTLINLILNYTIPFMIYCTFAGGIDFSCWWNIVVKCLMVDMAASFIPLPGGSGAAELSFTTLFASMFTGGKLFWALLLWRVLSYYGYIIQGLFIQIYDFLWGNKKHEWLKKKWALELESANFKKEQYETFEKTFDKQDIKTKPIKNKKK